MLDRVKPDGAIVAVPNQMHVKVGLACIARKIPIIVEKPVADSVAEALELVEAGEKANVPILVGHHRRHNPIMRKAAEIIAGGGIGRVVAANGLWLSHKPKDYFDVAWRREAGGGPVLINAIHDIDCLRMLCGDVETVSAAASNATRKFEVEDTAAAVLHFKSGALGTLLVSDTVSGSLDLGDGVARKRRPAARHRELLHHCRHQGFAHGAQSAASLARAWAGKLVGAADAVARSRAPGRCLSRADAQFRQCHSRHRKARALAGATARSRWQPRWPSRDPRRPARRFASPT